jgi:hypothetical protein
MVALFQIEDVQTYDPAASIGHAGIETRLLTTARAHAADRAVSEYGSSDCWPRPNVE